MDLDRQMRIAAALTRSRELSRASAARARAANSDAGPLPPEPGVDWGDIGLSTAAGLRSLAEGSVSGLGDMRDLAAAHLNPRVLSFIKSAGAQASPLASALVAAAPNAADVASVTDPAMSRFSPTLQEVTRHQSSTPFGQAANLGTQLGVGLLAPAAFGAAVERAPALSRLGRDFLADEAGTLDLGGIKAYHGSPHDFDRFDSSKIGTGEGAQAYGHGLYFAQNEGVARSYRDALSSGQRGVDAPKFTALGGKPLQHVGPDDAHDIAEGGMPALDKRIADLHSIIGDQKAYDQHTRFFGQKDADENLGYFQRELAELEALKATGDLSTTKGHMYEVRINANPDDFLDWDRPMGEQSQQIKDRFQSSIGSHPYVLRDLEAHSPQDVMQQIAHQTAGEVYHGLGDVFVGGRPLAGGAYTVPYADHAVISKTLQNAGIPGIKYLDAGSRGPKTLLDGKPIPANDYAAQRAAEALDLYGSPDAAIAQLSQGRGYRDTDTAAAELLKSGRVKQHQGEGSRNYVVFDDKLIDIVKKYGLAGAVALGALSQEQAQQLSQGGRLAGRI